MSNQESHWPLPERPAGYVDTHVAWDGTGADPAGVLAQFVEVTGNE